MNRLKWEKLETLWTDTNYIDNQIYFLPEDALEAGLVDTLLRWSEIDEFIKNLTKKKKMQIPRKLLIENAGEYDEWGNSPTIAVVYGLGVCAMDEGINARWLEDVFLNLADNDLVDAVVFRVDSPGGDGMASDIVAEALRECSRKKPVIISQGQVAASGGYWISMYGDTIVAGASTVTGSIGVIGGWVYDEGFSDKLGMTSDFVKRGEHADLGFGIEFPFLGLQLPARNLTEEEQDKIESLFMRFYNTFVEKVADGRNMEFEEVEELARGRIYSGIQGKEVGLVDEVGGLSRAIQIARNAAKIPSGRYVKIVEFPENKGFINPAIFTPLAVGSNIQNDPVIQFLKLVSSYPGFPLPLLLPGNYPAHEQ